MASTRQGISIILSVLLANMRCSVPNRLLTFMISNTQLASTPMTLIFVPLVFTLPFLTNLNFPFLPTVSWNPSF